MKNKFVLITIILLFFSNVGITFAVSSSSSISSSSSSSPSFDTTALKTTLSTALDKINSAITKVSALVMNSTSKQTILNSLNSIKTKLTDYQTSLGNVKTYSDFQSLNQQILAYIHTNKDSIKQAYIDSLTAIAGDESADLTSYESKINILLQIMKVTCPSQKTITDRISDNLKSLDTLIGKLKIDVKAKNADNVKQELDDANTLCKSLYNDMVTLKVQCKQ